ncbi:hypothetical protein L596_025954 [Steinernema carpocapsae]|uniref:Uncharacterized protein n=1 Tax=Steinernema carpocapsae TaxID=34508 RepID=A0A4U5M993_STECR|nr:hypothetical protein L596_025954 [Steinernema carpocapsae]
MLHADGLGGRGGLVGSFWKKPSENSPGNPELPIPAFGRPRYLPKVVSGGHPNKSRSWGILLAPSQCAAAKTHRERYISDTCQLRLPQVARFAHTR